jgi:hypothetical protein
MPPLFCWLTRNRKAAALPPHSKSRRNRTPLADCNFGFAIALAARHRGRMASSNVAPRAPRTPPSEGLTPRARWTHITDAPLIGLALAREAGLILAWDDSHNLYLLDLAGNRVRMTRTPVPLSLAAISDDGSQIIAAAKDGDVWWLTRNLEPRLHQGSHRHLIGAALSPYGEYLAVSMNDNHTFIYDCLGRRMTNLLTHRPLRHLAFLVGQPYLIGAAEYGLAGCYELDGEPRWQDALWSSAGYVSASGEGYAILVSCYGHGLQRYGLDGTNEGAYHLGGDVARASIDFDGKTFAAATLEGEILLVNAAGQVMWRQMLPKPARDIALDGAGRCLIYGQETGEITLLDLARPPSVPEPVRLKPAAGEPSATATDAAAAAAVQASPVAAPRPAQAQLREPTWKTPVFDSETQAETAILGLIENPARVVVFTNRRRIEVIGDGGERVHASEVMGGVGRYLDIDASLVVAATDREVLVYEIASNTSNRFYERCTQLSHLRIDSEASELVIIEERDRLSRFSLSGERRWVQTIDAPVDSLAIGANRTCAITTEDGRLIVFDGEKRVIGEFRTLPREVLSMVRLGPRWITLAGKAQQVRSHQLDGTVEWQSPLPTEAWRLTRLAGRVVARAAGGRLFVLDVSGRMVLDSTEIPPESQLFLNRNDAASALFWRVGNLMVTDLVGRVQWRHISSETLGPMTAGAAGVACGLGRELFFFAD